MSIVRERERETEIKDDAKFLVLALEKMTAGFTDDRGTERTDLFGRIRR
jgi:hypothetical protein